MTEQNRIEPPTLNAFQHPAWIDPTPMPNFNIDTNPATTEIGYRVEGETGHSSSQFNEVLPHQCDWREQLFNDGETGPFSRVQLCAEAITSLRGILLDIDPGLLHPGAVPSEILGTPQALYEGLVQPWLARHPVLASAQVLNSGRGIHVVIRFADPVEIRSDGERRRWAGIVKVIQASLPTDPDAPGITALTRPVGSVNGKNGATVSLLNAGRPVPSEKVIALFDQLRCRPVKTVAGILFGTDRVSPCPICRTSGSSLAALDRFGQCYGSCGRVGLEQFYDVYLAPRDGTPLRAGIARKGGKHDPA